MRFVPFNKSILNQVKTTLYVRLLYAMAWYDEWEWDWISVRLYATVRDSNPMVWGSNAMLWNFNAMLPYGVCCKRHTWID